MEYENDVYKRPKRDYGRNKRGELSAHEVWCIVDLIETSEFSPISILK